MAGPRGYPLIGIGIHLPEKAPAVFRQWAAEYGEVFKIRVGWYNWVVVNSPEAMREIFDKQSINSSSKMPAPLGDDVVTGGKRMFTMPYGQKWRAYRAIVHQLVSTTMTATFIPTQEYETKQLLFDLATSNDNQRDFFQHLRRFSFSIIMTSAYGTRINRWDHEDVIYATQSSRLLGQISRAGAFVVDELPVLSRLPTWLQPGRQRAEAYAKPVLGAKMRLWDRLQEQMKAGKAPMSYSREMMENREAWTRQGLTDEDAAWIAGGIVEAGSETSSVTLHNLVLHLAANLSVQRAAHEEIMRVVGPDRLPTYDDIKDLPYIRACIKEVLRLCPFPVWGIKHYTDADIVYKNHVIPKGTVVLANTSFMHYDPERYDDPYRFQPERYLGHFLSSADYAAQNDPYKRDHFTFGAGRRICPGARLAENTLNIALANILWAFEIRPPIVDGKEASDMNFSDSAYEETSFRGPKPFSARFVPRSEERLHMIKEQWEVAQKTGYVLRGMTVNVDGIVQ
ncbi:putative O-methylsterigmatocystin oxidoreductase [Xylaria longipes]|nr:putative O-methylsterigmatocystin oxidoreductase [Xylaria longipes]